MSEVADITSGLVRLSVSQIASEFGVARATVSKYIESVGIAPSGKRAGYPVYRLRDVLGMIISTTGAEGIIDPDKLRPADRRAWWQSENARIAFLQETGQLILVDEVRCEMSMLTKIVVRFLETLPDVAERDLHCGPEVVEYLIRKTNQIRADIADCVLNEEADAA